MDFTEIIDNARNQLTIPHDRPSAVHDSLLTLVRKLKTRGEETIKGRMTAMEQADRTYRAYRPADADDKKAVERGEPVKIIYPITFAQLQTSAASLVGIFSRNPYFPLEGRGPSYFNNAKLMELDLQYQLDEIGYYLYIQQWILDTLKYGFGKLNIGFQRKMSTITHENEIVRMIPLLGLIMPNETTEEVVSFEGADLANEDPYAVLTDPSFSIGDFQKGNFVFTYRRDTLNCLKDDGSYFNLEGIPQSSTPTIESRRRSTRASMLTNGREVKGGEYIDLDICYVKLVPRDYQLSEVDRTQIWCITMANDSRIIKAEPSRYEHGEFPAAILEYTPDTHELTNPGMAETIDGLQTVMNWLLNSRIENVRRTVNNQMVIDPDILNTDDLEKRRNIIRLNRGKAGLMDRAFKQLVFQDVTQSHLTDANSVLQFIFRTSGYSDNAMGVQMPTGRTATEVAAINRLGSVRSQMTARSMWEQGFKPAGRQMIQNTQQWVKEDRFVKVDGDLAAQLGVDLSKLPGDLFKLGPADLQGFFKINMVDLDSQVDKMLVGGVLKEILMGMTQNPMVAQIFGLKPQAMFTRMLMMFGVPGISDLTAPVPPDVQKMMTQMMTNQQQGGPGAQVSVMPEEMLQKEEQKGNLVPFGGGNGSQTTGQFSPRLS